MISTKPRKKDFTVNNPVDDMDQDLESALEWMRCTETREDDNLLKCSIFESVRLS